MIGQILYSTDWAMPETQIGYFPDCGSSFLFNKARREGNYWGHLHALRGHSVPNRVSTAIQTDEPDIFCLQLMQAYGLATHHISSQTWPEIETELKQNPTEVEAIVSKHTTQVYSINSCLKKTREIQKHNAQKAFDPVNKLLQSCCKEAKSVEEIVENFKARAGWRVGDSRSSDAAFDKAVKSSSDDQIVKHYATATVADLERSAVRRNALWQYLCFRASPLSLKITFKLLNSVKDEDSLETCIKREWMVTSNFMKQQSDFINGVLAKLKKGTPTTPDWIYKNLEEVCSYLYTTNLSPSIQVSIDHVESFFENPDGQDIDLKFPEL